MTLINVADVASEGMKDPEFSREMRFFEGKIKIGIADQLTTMEFHDGKYQGTVPDADDEDCKIVIRGSDEHWRNMLVPLPKPFYQCLQTTAVKHGLYMSTTNETYAYLPALNRLLVLMRDAYKQGRGR